MPPDPLLGFIPTSNGEPPPLKIDEALVTYYFLLATIHDKMRKEYIPINNDIWAKRLAESVWPIVENLYVDKQFIIKAALIHVKADLAIKQKKNEAKKEPAKTGQNAALSKWRRMWNWLKAFIKESYRLAMRSFFDSAMHK